MGMIEAKCLHCGNEDIQQMELSLSFGSIFGVTEVPEIIEEWKEFPFFKCLKCEKKVSLRETVIPKTVLGIAQAIMDKGKLPSVEKNSYIKALESFMMGVAKMVKCLPSFASPSLEDGNSHIKEVLKKLIEKGDEK